MIFYPCHLTGNDYDVFKVAEAERITDHPREPSWGVYMLPLPTEGKPDYVTAVLCDCDVDDAQDRIWTHRGVTYAYEGTEED